MEKAIMLPTESTASQGDTGSPNPLFMGGLPFHPRTETEPVNQPAIKYEGFYGTYLTDPKQNPQPSSAESLQHAHTQGPSLMDLPPELHIKIISNILSSTAGPSGTISINPRAKTLSDPQGDFHGHDCSGNGQTKWQARRGILQTCHQLREEGLAILYHEHTFFARMVQPYKNELVSFEQRRFDRWLKSLGNDAEIRRVKHVTFGVEWPPLYQNGDWVRRKGEVRVSINRGKVTIGGSDRIAECAAQPLAQLEEFVGGMIDGKPMGVGMGYEEWTAVWDKVKALMKSGWGSPY